MRTIAGLALTLVTCLLPLAARQRAEPPLDAFAAAAGADADAAAEALDRIAEGWRHGYAAILVDIARLLPSPRPRAGAPDDRIQFGDGGIRPDRSDGAAAGRGLGPGALARQRLTSFLEKQTGQRFGDDLRAMATGPVPAGSSSGLSTSTSALFGSRGSTSGTSNMSRSFEK